MSYCGLQTAAPLKVLVIYHYRNFKNSEFKSAQIVDFLELLQSGSFSSSPFSVRNYHVGYNENKRYPYKREAYPALGWHRFFHNQVTEKELHNRCDKLN